MKKLFTLSLALAVLFVNGNSVFAADTLQVATDKGDVIGKKTGATFVFKGIPFAAPPIGNLRFAPTAEHEAWTTPREAFTYGSKCLQIPINSPGRGAEGSEDCLFLNVWRPENTEAKNLPVMVWIHGGGNVNGASNESVFGVELYDGAYLASTGQAVVVSINYRLGPLGFMAHPAVGSGNYALLDQLAALRWVQNNAAAFGGDASNVTVFGESAGAINILALLASPLSSGLFSKAIVQSGFLVEIPLQLSEAIGVNLSKQVGCEGDGEDKGKDNKEIAACLRSATGAQILQAADYGGVGKLRASVPTIDGEILPASVLETFRSGRGASVPLLIGATADEMATLGAIAADTDKVKTVGDYESRVRAYYGAKAELVLAQYPANKFATPRRTIEELLGDDAVHCPTRRIARAWGSKGTVWNYVFSHVGDSPLMKPYRAGHGLELPYVFHNQHAAVTSPRERELSEKIAGYWLNFARTGNPNGGKLPLWPAYQNEGYANLDIEIGAMTGFHREQCDFHDSLAF